MTLGVKEEQVAATPEAKATDGQSEKSRENYRRLEAAKESEREARIRAEMQNEQLRREMQEIKSMLAPKEKDPLDDVEDYVDPARLRAKLQLERAQFQKEAERIALDIYEKRQREDEQKNHVSRLKSEYRDYDEVMNPDNIVRLEKENPVLLESILEIQDPYKQKKLAYNYLKQSTPKPAEVPSIKSKVEENLRNPYHIEASSGTPSAVQFDVNSKSAREEAYRKLKAAQRRPIGDGSASRTS